MCGFGGVDGQRKKERKREASSPALFSQGSVKKDEVREGFLWVVLLREELAESGINLLLLGSFAATVMPPVLLLPLIASGLG